MMDTNSTGMQIDIKAARGNGKSVLAVNMALRAAKEGFKIFAAPNQLAGEFPEYIKITELNALNLDKIDSCSFVLMDTDYIQQHLGGQYVGIKELLNRKAVVVTMAQAKHNEDFSITCATPSARQFLFLKLLGTELIPLRCSLGVSRVFASSDMLGLKKVSA